MFGYNITTLIIILAIASCSSAPGACRNWRQHRQGHPELQKGSRGPGRRKGPGEIPPSATAAPQAATCPQCHKEVGGDFGFCPIAAVR